MMMMALIFTSQYPAPHAHRRSSGVDINIISVLNCGIPSYE